MELIHKIRLVQWVGMVLLGLMLSFGISGCGHDQYVTMVRESSLEMAEDVPIGEAFDDFFSHGKWQSFDATDGSKVVQFDGKCMWNNQEAKIKIQFIVHDKESFELGAIALNGDELNSFMAVGLVDKVFTEYRLNKKS